MSRDRAVFIVASVLGLAAAWPQAAEARRTVYINLDQVNVVGGQGQDPTLNAFDAAGFVPGPLSGWTTIDSIQRGELLYWLKEASIDFDLEFVTNRPAVGPYDMVVFGTPEEEAVMFASQGGGCSTSIGLSDCADAQAHNVAFTFPGCLSETNQQDMKRVAFSVYLSLGFGWGLEAVTGSGQIMGAYSQSALQFADQCTPIQGAPGCTPHPTCPDGEQNGWQEISGIAGLRVDDGPPVITILSPTPAQGNEQVPQQLTVEADVADMFGGLSVELEIVEAGQTVADEMPPYRWDLEIPEGQWTIRINATDADGNVTSEDVAVCRGDICDGGGDTSGDDGNAGSTGDDGMEPEPETGDTTGAPPPPPPETTTAGFGESMPETGCTCRADRTGPGWAWALLGLMMWRRRRRPTRL